MGKKWRIVGLLLAICISCMSPKAVLAADTEYDLNQNSEITIVEANSYAVLGSYAWLKYQPKKDGYLTLRAAAPLGAATPARGYVTLYNSTKSTALSSKSIFYNTAHSNNPYWTEFSFGLKGGQTYYIRVKSENGVSFSRTFTKTKDVSGDTRATAKKIKKNKKKTGLIAAGVTDVDWYKVTLKKAQKLRIYYSARTNGSFRITVYSATQQIGNRNIYYTSGEQKMVFYQYQEKSKKTTGLAAGTYYVKIEKASTSSSGYYQFWWK